ncbi:hypothetical protein SAMN05518672_1011584 [Chitinophaga sp. CF118]|nr:hypothetical protein SAMN05518672_1011584 [Chitinophaga sp. CF118]
MHIFPHLKKMWKNIYKETLKDTTFAVCNPMAFGLPLISIRVTRNHKNGQNK